MKRIKIHKAAECNSEKLRQLKRKLTSMQADIAWAP